MSYDIVYAIACEIGRVRTINQDNFWCMGKYLNAENNGLESIENGSTTSEKRPIFAIFDGMGGDVSGIIKCSKNGH